jgi:hypothetical protein
VIYVFAWIALHRKKNNGTTIHLQRNNNRQKGRGQAVTSRAYQQQSMSHMLDRQEWRERFGATCLHEREQYKVTNGGLMKFKKAVKEIRGLFPLGTFIKFAYEVSEMGGDMFNHTCTVYTVSKGEQCVHFTANTWQGVIDKIKIHQLPKGEPSIEEAPDEVQA